MHCSPPPSHCYTSNPFCMTHHPQLPPPLSPSPPSMGHTFLSPQTCTMAHPSLPCICISMLHVYVSYPRHGPGTTAFEFTCTQAYAYAIAAPYSSAQEEEASGGTAVTKRHKFRCCKCCRHSRYRRVEHRHSMPLHTLRQHATLMPCLPLRSPQALQ